MKKILIEMIAVLLTLIVAGAIILILFTQNVGQTTFDTFKGNVYKLPLNITSPVYGQILTLPVAEGDSIHKGQMLATIHILNRDTIPQASPLYHINGMTLSIQSPSDGVVGQISFAPLSTVAGAGSLMQIYTVDTMEVQILIPQDSDIHSYTAFSALHLPDQHRYALHVIGQIPTNVLANVDPTISIYRATCSNCQALINNEAIAIYAQKKQVQSPILDGLRSIWNTVLNHL